MATDKNHPNPESAGRPGPGAARGEGGMTQRRRWLVFGSNVAVAILLATVLAGVVVWLSGVLLKGRTRSDWTATGRFSLSPRSKAMLKDLPCKVTLTNLYAHSPDVPESEAQWQRVQDLLAEYDMASDQISVEAVNPAIDTGAVENLVARLRERYASELLKPKALVEQFGGLHKEIGDLLLAEAKRLNAAADAWKDGPPDAVNAFRMVSQRWQQLKLVGDFTASGVQALAEQALPSYSNALSRAKEYFRQVGDNFGAVPDLYTQVKDLAKDAAMPDPVKALLDSGGVYDPLRKRIEDFQKEADSIKESELESVRRDIAQGEVLLLETYAPKGVIRVPADAAKDARPVALGAGAEEVIEPAEGGEALKKFKGGKVITPPDKLDAVKKALEEAKIPVEETATEDMPDQIKVVSFDDVWVRNPQADQRQEARERLFAGETAISSALLGTCFKEKPALLFVTAGAPATGMGGMMGMRGGAYAEMAERLRKANFIVEDWDVLRQPEMPHPEHASKTILVFVPPPPPNPQMPMPPPSPEQYRAAIDAVKGGAPAILLGEPAGMFQQAAPYTELFDLFGVDAKFNAVAVRSVVTDAAGTEKAIPQIEITSYAKHPITGPLGALPAMLLTASPLVVKKDLPEGVTVQPLVDLPDGRDYWADTVVFEALRGEAKRDDAEDIPGPVPLAAAATRKIADGVQKVVLFGDADFAQDRVAFYRDMFGQSLFPGNAELLLNACLWVSGTEHLITVSPEALEARRLGDVGGWQLPLKALLIGGLPAAVLLVGIVVYVIRRR